MAWWGIAGLGAWFDSGYMVCVSSWVLLDGFSIIFCVIVFSDPEVDAAPSMLQLLPQLVTHGNWTQRPRASRTWQFLVRCLGVLFMAQCLVQQWVHAVRQLLVFLEGFLREGELES